MLYFIQSGNRIKIGHGNPFSRYKAINTASSEPCKLLLALHVVDERGAEQQLHRHFRSHRTNGEWFEINFNAAFRALLELKLVPEHDAPTLEIPVVGDPHPLFKKWFLATCARDWSPEEKENAKANIGDHWHKEHEQFTTGLREYDGDVDEMIRMQQPITDQEGLDFISAMRNQLKSLG